MRHSARARPARAACARGNPRHRRCTAGSVADREEPDVARPRLDTISSIRARWEGGIDAHQRAVERATALLGRPRTLYFLLVVVVSWIAFNGFPPDHLNPPPDPPPFFWLQGAIAFTSLLLTTLVLITQNRQSRHAEERAHLELQVNLLAEEKVTKLIALVEELRRDLPMVHDRLDPEAERLQHAVDPHAVLEVLESTKLGEG